MNTYCINAISANESGRYDAKLWTIHHVIITMGSVDSGNIQLLLLLLLLLVIRYKESRRGLRFIDRQRTLGGDLGKRCSIPVWRMDSHVSEIDG